MSEQRKARVAIVGCGLIGTQWDQPASDRMFSLTHASAFTRNPASELVAVCDQDALRAEQAALTWGAKLSFSDPSALFGQTAIDLAVIACSSDARLSVVDPALKAGVRTFVIEKPLATTLAESRKLVDLLEQAGAKALVNFSRRWDPAMRMLHDRIRDGALGRIQRMTGYYGKGITNNGSHMIDLAGLLCEARPVRARSLGSPLPLGEAGWSKGGADRAVDAQVVFANQSGDEFHLTMLGTDQAAFTIFELRLMGTDGYCEISRGGRRITITGIQDDPDFRGYRIPSEPLNMEARYKESMECMADEAVRLTFGGQVAPSCDVHTALRTAATVEAVKMSEAEGGRWIDTESFIH